MKGRSIARHYLKPSNAIADTGLPVRTSLRLAGLRLPLKGGVILEFLEGRFAELGGAEAGRYISSFQGAR